MTKTDPFLGISRDRRRNLPRWLVDHLAILAGEIDKRDARLEVVGQHHAHLQVTADRAVAELTDAQNEISRLHAKLNDTVPVEHDHTMFDLERDGRFDGDYQAMLKYDPMTDQKRPWRVNTFEWVVKECTPRGHAEGYEDTAYWTKGSHNGLVEGYDSKSFKHDYQAIEYLCRVRAFGDKQAVRRRVAQVAGASAQRIA